MKRKTLIAFSTVMVSVLAFVVLNAIAANIKPQDVAGAPKAYCKVIKEPDPLLMGGWQCVWAFYIQKLHEHDTNPVEFWLIKRDNRYALYLYRTKDGGRKKYIGWRTWTINGKEIYSETKDMRFFTEGGEVFFKWKQEKPIKMSRIQGSS